MMEPILAAFRAKAAAVRYAEPALPFVSSMTGEWLDGSVDWVDYCTHHIRQTVLYGPGLREVLQGDEPRVLLEVGPSQTLTALVRAMTAGNDRAVPVASWPKPTEKGSDAVCLLGALGQLWCHGYPVAFSVLHDSQSPPNRVPMSTYPFQGKRYWIDRADAPIRVAEGPRTGGAIDSLEADAAAPTPQRFERPDLSAAFRAPGTNERLVIEVWSELLGIREIGVDDDFFEMGGDSLLATQISARSTSTGGRVANFSLATSRQWSGQSGDKQEKTEWHMVVAWNNAKGGTGLADVVERFCKKGDKVYENG